MNGITIIGGGRWARQIIQTLISNNKIKNLYCYTKKSNFYLKDWLKKNKFNDYVKLINKVPLNKSKSKLAIICNKSSNHFKFAKIMLRKKYNIFVEKPVTLKSKNAYKLLKISQKNNRKIFCSNIFSFSSGLKKLFLKIKLKKIIEIDFFWHDKLNEYRYGEMKKYDSKIPIYLDVLFHVFPILDQIIKRKKYKITNVKKKVFFYNQAVINLMINKIKINIYLNRRAKKRVRLIKLKGKNDNYIVDFSRKKYVLKTYKNLLIKNVKYFKDQLTPIENMFKNIFRLINTNKPSCERTGLHTTLKYFYSIEEIINYK
tara:strand:- start:97 stop:1041 length:945 start_codon:yes stop_codon:yes gene_type:complete